MKLTINEIANESPEMKVSVLLAYGAYASAENEKLANENNIELVTTSLVGKSTNLTCADFVIDEENKTVKSCPSGKKPFKTSYYEKVDEYRAYFNNNTCDHCPLKESCPITSRGKKTTAVRVTPYSKNKTYEKDGTIRLQEINTY